MKTKIFNFLQILLETITGRKCSKCKHYDNGIGNNACVECNRKIFPIGWERKGKSDALKEKAIEAWNRRATDETQ
jgi:hypothetical protein